MADFFEHFTERLITTSYGKIRVRHGGSGFPSSYCTDTQGHIPPGRKSLLSSHRIFPSFARICQVSGEVISREHLRIVRERQKQLHYTSA
jgi:hypothetical protein